MKAIKKGYCVRLTNKNSDCKRKDRVKYIGPIDGDIYVSSKEVKKQLDKARKYYGEKYICDVVPAKVSVGDDPIEEDVLCEIIQ